MTPLQQTITLLVALVLFALAAAFAWADPRIHTRLLAAGLFAFALVPFVAAIKAA